MKSIDHAHSALIPSPLSRRHRSFEERRQWVLLHQRSGQTLKEFCAENGLAVSTLLLWRRQVREDASTSSSTARLVEVAMHPPAFSPSAIHVHLPRGVRLEAQPSADPVWLAQLLSRLCLAD